MPVETIGLIGLVALLALLALRIPVALTMFLVGFVGIWAVRGWDGAIPILSVILITIGGIYGGLFSPVEAAGVGAGLVILYGMVMRRLSFGERGESPIRPSRWAGSPTPSSTSPVSDHKRAAIESMHGQEHMWAYYTRLAEQRANHFKHNSGGQAGGRDCRYAHGFQSVFPRMVDSL